LICVLPIYITPGDNDKQPIGLPVVFDKKGTKAGTWEISFAERAIRQVHLVKFLGLHTATMEKTNRVKKTN
jgi:hypothetical protein